MEREFRVKQLTDQAKWPIAYTGLTIFVALGTDNVHFSYHDSSIGEDKPHVLVSQENSESYDNLVFREWPDVNSEESKLQLYQREFEQSVEPIFLKNRELIENIRPNGAIGNLEVLRKNHAIYRAVADKYGVPWYGLLMFHDGESTCSLDPEAFSGGTTQYGAMQRETTLYGDDEVIEAAKGLEFLADLPQEHWDDWREIAWAASKLDRDAKKAQENYSYKDRNWVLEDAFFAFNNNPGVAQGRIEKFRILREIFGS